MSNWKDTVMNLEQLNAIPDWDSQELTPVLEAQAEISFKAGQEEQPRTPQTDLENELADKEYARLYREARIKTQREIDLCFEAHKAGIMEVVEALKKPCPHSHDCISQVNIGSCAICWQSQLKEWGIDED